MPANQLIVHRLLGRGKQRIDEQCRIHSSENQKTFSYIHTKARIDLTTNQFRFSILSSQHSLIYDNHAMAAEGTFLPHLE